MSRDGSNPIARALEVEEADAGPHPLGEASDPGAQRQAEGGAGPHLDAVDDFQSQRMRLEAGDRVFFAPASAELGLRARGALARQAAWLRAIDASVRVVGHADDGGPAGSNQALSERRAAEVRQRLVEEGIPDERIEIAARSDRDRVALCDSVSCRAQNRRAVLKVLKRAATERPSSGRQ